MLRLRGIMSLCFIAYISLSLGLTVLFDLPWRIPLFGRVGMVVGGLLVVLGLCLQAWSFRSLGWRRALGAELFTSASEGELVTSGVYAHTRNPLYLAAILLLLGLFFLSRLTPLGLLTVMFACHFVAVAKWEEWELRQRFGDAYNAYSKKVPLFIPRWKAGD